MLYSDFKAAITDAETSGAIANATWLTADFVELFGSSGSTRYARTLRFDILGDDGEVATGNHCDVFAASPAPADGDDVYYRGVFPDTGSPDLVIQRLLQKEAKKLRRANEPDLTRILDILPVPGEAIGKFASRKVAFVMAATGAVQLKWASLSNNGKNLVITDVT